jgi:hypothetical protein
VGDNHVWWRTIRELKYYEHEIVCTLTEHSPPSSAEVKEWVELYLHSPVTVPYISSRETCSTTLPVSEMSCEGMKLITCKFDNWFHILQECSTVSCLYVTIYLFIFLCSCGNCRDAPFYIWPFPSQCIQILDPFLSCKDQSDHATLQNTHVLPSWEKYKNFVLPFAASNFLSAQNKM